MIYDGSNSVEGLAAHLDKMVANIMHIDKNIVTTARKWLKIIERAAISDGIDKVEQILNQEERQTTTQILEDIVETKEIEMLTEPKTYSNHKEASSEKIVEILLALPANDATIAAVSAAKAMPFKPGGGGRPAGVRNRFSHAFLTDFLADWEQHGAAAIKTVRVRDPGCYLRTAAAILPKELMVETMTTKVRASRYEMEFALIAKAR